MTNPFLWALTGYLCGSVLFANVFSKVFRKTDMLEHSKDHNPGAANAYLHGGFWCGTCTLCGDILKGLIPIHCLALLLPMPEMDWRYALVLAAPVIGHAFPIFHHWRGGKGIAVTFGCLLGLFPYALPFALFAGFFIFFSVVLRISPHFYRTIFAYAGTAFSLVLLKADMVVCLGFFITAVTVCLRLHLSQEKREEMKVRLSWMH